QTERIFDISPSRWQQNCEEKELLLRYLAVPVQETEHKLWLAVDDENNLTACEIFAFMTHKQIEPVVIASDELKYLLNALSPEQQPLYEESELAFAEQEQEQLNLSDPII
ncbi:hypothetical protein, partial [Raoultella ornithinolytica]